MTSTRTPTIKVHSHRGEDGAKVLAAAGIGAIVRRDGYRRYWMIASLSGQLAQLVAVHRTSSNTRPQVVAHASALTLIRPAQVGAK